MTTDPSSRSTLKTIGRTLLSLCIGILVGLMFHYLVYRLSLPLKPFVYVAF